jgi:hypothetical protein
MTSLGQRIVAVAFSAALAHVPAARAQTPTDSVARADSTTLSRAWLSLGFGGGSSSFGGFAARAAGSIAVAPRIVFTIEGTSVGGYDRGVSSINLMVGTQGSDPTAFPFGSIGLANVSCGSGCAHQTGVAFDAGYHGGWKHAGGSIVVFVVRAPRGTNSGGVVATFDLGLFARR